MHTSPHYLELTFLASTITPAWGAGWAYTATPAPRPLPVAHPAAPVVLQLAVIGDDGYCTATPASFC